MTQPQTNVEGAQQNGGTKPAVSRWTSLSAAVLLLVIVGAMIALGVVGRRDMVLEAEHWRPVWLSNPVGWLAGVFVGQFWLAATFALIGVLVPLVTAMWPRLAASPVRWLLWLVDGVVLAAAICGARLGELPSVAVLLVPLVGFVAGVWVADRWVRRDWSWRRPLVSTVVAVLVTVALAAVVTPRVVSRTPLDIPDAEVSDEARGRVAELINESRPQRTDVRTLRLSEADLNTLVGVAMARGGAQRTGRVRLEEGILHAEATLRLPHSGAEASYFNVAASGKVRIDNDRLFVRLERLTIGEIGVPALLLRFFSPALVSLSMDDRDARCLICSIDSLTSDAEAVTVVLKPGDFSRDVVPAVVGILGGQPNVAEATELYVRHLVDVAGNAAEGDARFTHVVTSVFELAQQRSRRLAAKHENRAAIFALAIVFGHDGVETLVGRVTDDALRSEMAPLAGTLSLRGRRDWARHWLVSAAIEVTGIADVSEQMGVFKEKLDAGEGGSGFSFADLAADRAGMRFAVAATRDMPAASAMQERLTAGFSANDVCPAIDDLPEGLTAARLTDEYGGVGGLAYEKLLEDIDR
jgi:hypothetical protein